MIISKRFINLLISFYNSSDYDFSSSRSFHFCFQTDMDPHDDVAEKDPGAQKVVQNFDETDYEGEYWSQLST